MSDPSRFAFITGVIPWLFFLPYVQELIALDFFTESFVVTIAASWIASRVGAKIGRDIEEEERNG